MKRAPCAHAKTQERTAAACACVSYVYVRFSEQKRSSTTALSRKSNRRTNKWGSLTPVSTAARPQTFPDAQTCVLPLHTAGVPCHHAGNGNSGRRASTAGRRWEDLRERCVQHFLCDRPRLVSRSHKLKGVGRRSEWMCLCVCAVIPSILDSSLHGIYPSVYDALSSAAHGRKINT